MRQQHSMLVLSGCLSGWNAPILLIFCKYPLQALLDRRSGRAGASTIMGKSGVKELQERAKQPLHDHIFDFLKKKVRVPVSTQRGKRKRLSRAQQQIFKAGRVEKARLQNGLLACDCAAHSVSGTLKAAACAGRELSEHHLRMGV
jgi:hypothetical protein